jgi:hypothetical protein
VGVICLIAGTLSFYKVIKGSRGVYEIVITSLIALNGLNMIGEAFCCVIWVYGCDKYFTNVNFKWLLLSDALGGILDVHFWIFAVKYLTKGIEYTRLKSNDWIEHAVKIGLYLVLVLYEAYITALVMIMYFTFPVFKPGEVTSIIECDRDYN